MNELSLPETQARYQMEDYSSFICLGVERIERQALRTTAATPGPWPSMPSGRRKAGGLVDLIIWSGPNRDLRLDERSGHCKEWLFESRRNAKTGIMSGSAGAVDKGRDCCQRLLNFSTFSCTCPFCLPEDSQPSIMIDSFGEELDQYDSENDTNDRFDDPDGTHRTVLGQPEHGVSGGTADGRDCPIWFTWFKVVSADGEVHYENRGKVGMRMDEDTSFEGSWMQSYYLPYRKQPNPCSPSLSWIKSMAMARIETPSTEDVPSEDATLTRLRLHWKQGSATFTARYEPTAASKIERETSHKMPEMPAQTHEAPRPRHGKPLHVSLERTYLGSHWTDGRVCYVQKGEVRGTSAGPLRSDMGWIDRLVVDPPDLPLHEFILTWDRSNGLASYTATYVDWCAQFLSRITE